MKKLLLTLTLLLTLGFAASAQGEATPYMSLTFSKNNSKKVNNYTTTWTQTIGTYSWEMVNFGNNNNGEGQYPNNSEEWKKVRCGKKKNNTTDPDFNGIASITTNFAINVAVDKVVVPVFKVNNANKVNSIMLLVSDGPTDTDFSNAISVAPDEDATNLTNGEDATLTYSITNPQAGKYYRLLVDYTSTTTKNGVIDIYSVDYYEATVVEPETELVGFTHEESFGKTVVRVEYMLHLNNHKDANEYTVELSVGDHVFTNADHSDASIVEDTANAPMRALDPNEIRSETTLKGTIMATGFEGDTPYGEAKLVAKLGDKELGSATISDFTTGTTGIEDVTVEGNEAAAEYFNLQGVRVAQPEAGRIYIVRRGAKATKERVK